MSASKAVSEKIVLVLKGYCIGIADIIPGISGGTMALILKIYPDLIQAIRSFDLCWLKGLLKLKFDIIFKSANFGFLMPLLIGVVAALFCFTQIINLPTLINTHPEWIYSLFFGLISGSIVVLFPELGKITYHKALFFILGLASIRILLMLIPQDTPEATWFIFICGFVSSCAMLLPGISGSFILLILKKYGYILTAIGQLQFSVLIPFILGAGSGIIFFSRFIHYLLERAYTILLAFMLGLLTASLPAIWPFKNNTSIMIAHEQKILATSPIWPDVLSAEVWAAIFMTSVGFLFVLGLHVLAKKFSKKTTNVDSVLTKIHNIAPNK